MCGHMLLAGTQDTSITLLSFLKDSWLVVAINTFMCFGAKNLLVIVLFWLERHLGTFYVYMGCWTNGVIIRFSHQRWQNTVYESMIRWGEVEFCHGGCLCEKIETKFVKLFSMLKHYKQICQKNIQQFPHQPYLSIHIIKHFSKKLKN